VAEFLAAIRSQGVLAGSPGPGKVRMVTHYGIESGDIDEALERIARALPVAVAS